MHVSIDMANVWVSQAYYMYMVCTAFEPIGPSTQRLGIGPALCGSAYCL